MRRENESGKHLLGRKDVLRNRSGGNLADTDGCCQDRDSTTVKTKGRNWV